MAQSSQTGIKIVKRIIIGLAMFLAFLGAISPNTRTAVFINLTFLIIAYIIYSTKEYKDEVSTYRTKGALIAVFYGASATILFFIATRFIPGLSLAFPSVPGAIADSLKFFLVVIVAPFVEEVFFRGGMLSFFQNISPKAKHWPVWAQASAFSLWHLTAFIVGFYMLPDVASGFSSFLANFSVFFMAFSFGLISGYVVSNGKNTKKNLWFSSTFHLGLNLIAYNLAIAIII